MSLQKTISSIAKGYAAASNEEFAGHELAKFIRRDAPKALVSAIGSPGFIAKGSSGQSTWADVPWLAVFDPFVTVSATRGYYIVYLFSADMRFVYLCLGQGTTAVKEEFGRAWRAELRRRAQLIIDRTSSSVAGLSKELISLGGATTLAQSYEPAVALSKRYKCDELPSEHVLKQDLIQFTSIYLKLSEAGGVDNFTDLPDAQDQSIEEKRTYRRHRRIERNAKVARQVKTLHGTDCQGCSLNFGKKYGPPGEGYIEAHHLTPLASLPKGTPITLNIKTDFAVLCANCHRMMHRKNGPKSIAELRALLGLE
jgi:5-methylcytosine-specific restriction protein A